MNANSHGDSSRRWSKKKKWKTTLNFFAA